MGGFGGGGGGGGAVRIIGGSLELRARLLGCSSASSNLGEGTWGAGEALLFVNFGGGRSSFLKTNDEIERCPLGGGSLGFFFMSTTFEENLIEL